MCVNEVLQLNRKSEADGNRLERVIDPPGEHSRFHPRAPLLWQRFHLDVQVQARGCERSFGVHLATAVLHAMTDLPLVNIQSDVIHRFHGGASLVFLNQRPLSSAFLHQALLLRPIHSNLPGVENDFLVGLRVVKGDDRSPPS